MNESEQSQLVQEQVLKLMEQFDSVLTICTINEGGFTRRIVRRGGNYYASKGAINDWLKEEDYQELATEINKSDDV